MQSTADYASERERMVDLIRARGVATAAGAAFDGSAGTCGAAGWSCANVEPGTAATAAAVSDCFKNSRRPRTPRTGSDGMMARV